LLNDLAHRMQEWEALGIDPDDFLRCCHCHQFIAELVEGTKPALGPNELCTCDPDKP
jgi:hypothetical protein